MTQLERDATSVANVKKLDLKLEVIVIPVSDVDRAKEFYGNLRWRLDADFPFNNGFRVVQFTPPVGSLHESGHGVIRPRAGTGCREDWVDELEFIDILPEPTSRDWRSVTIAAAARLANRLNVDADRRTPRDSPADTIVSPIHSSNCPAATRLA